ncbi:MAG TPA: hypothetical protein VJC10_01275 [Patescibacteria group bacterium]|nr:hypothetical protein [Patescibacteria group bacterium]
MKKAIFFTVFFIFLFLDSVITTFPLTLLLLICATAIWKESFLLVLTFLAGIIIDIHAVRPIGQTSLFFTLVLTAILLYERKYEIASLPFLIIMSFIVVIIYAFVFGYQAPLAHGLLSIPFSVLLFFLLSLSVKKQTKIY